MYVELLIQMNCSVSIANSYSVKKTKFTVDNVCCVSEI